MPVVAIHFREHLGLHAYILALWKILTDFPDDFITERKLLQMRETRRIYLYKDQVWFVQVKGLDTERAFKGTHLEGDDWMTEDFLTMLKTMSPSWQGSIEATAALLDRPVGPNVAYLENLRFLSDKTDRIPRLIFEGFFNENLHIMVLSRVPGVHVYDLVVPCHRFIKAVIDAYDMMEEFYHKWGYVFGDSHFGNFLIDDDGRPSFIDLENDEIVKKPHPGMSQVFQVESRMESYLPWSVDYDPDNEELPWNEERKLFVAIYERALAIKELSDDFMGFKMRDPLMKLMAPFLFQLYIEHESSDGDQAFIFVICCLTTMEFPTRFIKPLKSTGVIEKANAKWKELGVKIMIDTNACGSPRSVFSHSFRSGATPQRGVFMMSQATEIYKKFIDGIHVGYSEDDRSVDRILHFSSNHTQLVELIE